MERITTPIDLLSEMDEIGQMIKERGTGVLGNESVRNQVSRLLAIHRNMDKKNSRSVQTPKDPLALMKRLERFRKYLKNLFADKGLSLRVGKEIAAWDKDCKRIIDRVSVYSAGLGHFDDRKILGVKRDGTAIAERADELIGLREDHVRIPFFVATAIRSRKRELIDALNYLNKQPKNPEGLPAPMTLTQQSTHDFQSERPCNPYLSRPQKNRLSLTHRRSQQK